MVAESYKHVSIIPGGAGEWSDPVKVPEGRRVHFSVFGTLTATLELQIRFRFSKADDWRTWVSVTAETEQSFLAVVDLEIRVGASAYTSGSPLVEARVSGNRANA